MYYLENIHPEYEYAIYCRVSNATPYIIPRTFNSFLDVQRFFTNTTRRHDRFHQIYYIDNKFYNNKYSNNMNGYYYKVLKRLVNDWKNIDDEETNEKNDKLINFSLYR